MKLDSLCDVISGQITSRLKGKEDDSDTRKIEMKVLIPKAIKDGRVDHEALVIETFSKKPSENNITKEGDIVFKLSSPYGAAYIDKEDEGLLIPSFCCRMTNIREIDPLFLVMYLNSESAKYQYVTACGGAVIPILKISSVRNLDIIDVSREEQKDISARYRNIIKLKKLVEYAYNLELANFEYAFGREKNVK